LGELALGLDELAADRGSGPVRRTQLVELLLHVEHERREPRRHAVVVAAELLARAREPVAAAGLDLAQGAVRRVQQRRRLDAGTLLVGGARLVAIGVETPAQIVIATLELRLIHARMYRQAENGEVVRVLRQALDGRAAPAQERRRLD